MRSTVDVMSESPVTVDLPASVTLADGEGGLPVLRVGTPRGTGEIYLHGAHVTAWTPAGHDPVIWMSGGSAFAADAPIRGGVPICFPWFGPGRDGKAQPAHGFARLAEFAVVDARDDDGEVTVSLRLTEAEVTGLPGADGWPHPFELTYTVTMGEELTLAVGVRNTGEDSISFEEALHTYLHVADATAARVEGLDGVTYLDKVAEGGPAERTQEGPVTVTGETDRVYRSTATATVVDPGRARTMTVAKDGSADTVVWNPWVEKAAAMPDYDDAEWPTMVCVETANAFDDAVTLAPGESHTMTARIGVAHD